MVGSEVECELDLWVLINYRVVTHDGVRYVYINRCHPTKKSEKGKPVVIDNIKLEILKGEDAAETASKFVMSAIRKVTGKE